MRTGFVAPIFLIFVLLFSTVSPAQKRSAKKAAAQKADAAGLAIPRPYADLLKDTSQVMVVTTAGWNAVDGSMLRFEKRDGHWQQVGDKIPVVVGKNGIGWDGILEPPSVNGQPVKKEGDGRSPAGIFPIGEAFGFEPAAPDLKLHYRPLTEYIECVDDGSSSAYNQVVDRQQIPHPDWNSSEKMRTIDVYKEGAVVNYNGQHISGAGSCIFMHIWKGSGRGTAGCTAMEESKLQETLGWLDASKKPVLIQLPAAIYEDLRDGWQLP